MILMFGTGYIHVLYLGRAPRTKETLPDFREKCLVARHSRVFRGLTGSQRTPEFWGVTTPVTPGSPVITMRPILRVAEMPRIEQGRATLTRRDDLV